MASKKERKRPHFDGLWTQKRANGKGVRYLLKGKGQDGKYVFVTVPIEDRDSDSVFIRKCEEAKIELDRKINPPKDLEWWIERYIAMRHLRTGSQYQYRHHLAGFSLDDENNTRKVLEIMNSGKSESSIKQMIGIINTFFKFIINSGVQIKNPAVGIRTGRFHHRTRIPTDEEVEIILNWSMNNEEDELFFRLLMSTGARCSTLEVLRCGDLSDDGHIKLYNVKCQKIYDFPILITDERLKTLWASVAEGKKPDAPLFTDGVRTARRIKWAFYKKIPPVSVGGQTERLSPHSMRHLFATKLLQRGVELEKISKLLDHSNVSTTLSFYAAHSQEQLDDALQKLD